MEHRAQSPALGLFPRAGLCPALLQHRALLNAARRTHADLGSRSAALGAPPELQGEQGYREAGAGAVTPGWAPQVPWAAASFGEELG